MIRRILEYFFFPRMSIFDAAAWSVAAYLAIVENHVIFAFVFWIVLILFSVTVTLILKGTKK